MLLYSRRRNLARQLCCVPGSTWQSASEFPALPLAPHGYFDITALEAFAGSMASTRSHLVAGRLALDFANLRPVDHDLSWDEFLSFLVDAGVVSEDRAARLKPLLSTEPQAVDAALLRALRLRESFRAIFASVVDNKPFPAVWAAPINEILRVTEGHDELVFHKGGWALQFVGRESGLDWLLAAIARSAAELLVEGSNTLIRRCANPSCRLFFCDESRTHRRRWCSMTTCGNRHKVAAFLRRHSPHRGEATHRTAT
jgi:predicted RNA-binding Zn ribbon-like protein